MARERRSMKELSIYDPDGEMRLAKELQARVTNPVFECIGTEKVFSDSLGPRVGTLLNSRMRKPRFVYGLCQNNITAENLACCHDFIKKMHPDGDLKNRINCLYTLKELGYETGTGILVGLPYQEIDSYADDILFFKKLNADMIGLGPFIAHSQTELKNAKNGDLTLALKVMALTRIIMPKINIPATTAMETIEKNGRIKALKSGANVVMPNITPENIKENYSIYPDKKGVDVYKNSELDELKKEITSIGDSISDDFGTSKNYKHQ